MQDSDLPLKLMGYTLYYWLIILAEVTWRLYIYIFRFCLFGENKTQLEVTIWDLNFIYVIFGAFATEPV